MFSGPSLLDIGVTIGYKDKRRMIYRSGNEEINGKGATETGLWFKALDILYNASMKVKTYDSVIIIAKGLHPFPSLIISCHFIVVPQDAEIREHHG